LFFSYDFPMQKKKENSRHNEQGSALVYILIAIALLALLTITFMQPASQQTGSQNTFKLVSELQTQADFIRSAAQECVINYSGGDAGALSGSPAPQSNQPYPLNPTSTYFSGCGSNGAAANDSVEYLRCPGNPGDNVCHAAMFGGATGKFLPPTPDLFDKMADGANGWQWYNGPDGVFFWIATSKTDAFITTALQKLDAAYAKCEAEVISAGSNLDNAGTASCPAGSKCFRVWMITKPGALFYDAGCP
jgi:hypothetical protein